MDEGRRRGELLASSYQVRKGSGPARAAALRIVSHRTRHIDTCLPHPAFVLCPLNLTLDPENIHFPTRAQLFDRTRCATCHATCSHASHDNPRLWPRPCIHLKPGPMIARAGCLCRPQPPSSILLPRSLALSLLCSLPFLPPPPHSSLSCGVAASDALISTAMALWHGSLKVQPRLHLSALHIRPFSGASAPPHTTPRFSPCSHLPSSYVTDTL
jgi:hypothetical protein